VKVARRLPFFVERPRHQKKDFRHFILYPSYIGPISVLYRLYIGFGKVNCKAFFWLFPRKREKTINGFSGFTAALIPYSSYTAPILNLGKPFYHAILSLFTIGSFVSTGGCVDFP